MRIQRLFHIIGVAQLLLLSITANSRADSVANSRQWAVGWQYSRPVTGLSLRCPILNDYYLQPVFLVDMNNEGESCNEMIELGLRGIYNLKLQNDFRPYTGIGLGFNKKKTGTATEFNIRGGTGFEVFFGIEYLKYPVHPSLELAIGGFDRMGGNFEAGITGNFMLMYYF